MIRPWLVAVGFLGALVASAGAGPQAPASGPALQLAQAAAIEAPFTVDPGQTVSVTVTGGVTGGRLEIWGPVTQTGRGGLLAGGEAAGGPVPVTAPNEPGSYELRYVSPGGGLLARRSFEVAAHPVRLWVPEQLGAGIPGAVRWRGPARPGDRLQIVDPATGAVVSEAAAEGSAGAENLTMVRAPQAIGDYQLRYVSGQGIVQRVLPIRVGPSRTWLRSPIEVFVRESFPVTWHGPAEEGQMFQIVEPESGTAVVSAAPETGPASVSATLRAPARAGNYRLRLVNTQTGQVYADLPLDVDAR
jgi:hypothetical protein